MFRVIKRKRVESWLLILKKTAHHYLQFKRISDSVSSQLTLYNSSEKKKKKEDLHKRDPGVTAEELGRAVTCESNFRLLRVIIGLSILPPSQRQLGKTHTV